MYDISPLNKQFYFISMLEKIALPKRYTVCAPISTSYYTKCVQFLLSGYKCTAFVVKQSPILS